MKPPSVMTLMKSFRPGGTVYGAVYAPTAHECSVGRSNEDLDLRQHDVAGHDLDLHRLVPPAPPVRAQSLDCNARLIRSSSSQHPQLPR